MKKEEEVDEACPEKIEMKEFNPGQKNLREDGEQGHVEDEHDEEAERGPQGIQCGSQ